MRIVTRTELWIEDISLASHKQKGCHGKKNERNQTDSDNPGPLQWPSVKCYMAFHASSCLGKKSRRVRIALVLAYETGTCEIEVFSILAKVIFKKKTQKSRRTTRTFTH